MSRKSKGIALPPPVTVLSLGAGVQSSTIALMAAAGEITPMPDCAIFADTQAEPKAVYQWLDWLETRLPFPVHCVTAGSLRAALAEVKTSKAGSVYVNSPVPAFMLGADGRAGISMRRCTADYKIDPIVRFCRQWKKQGVTTLIGISVDEAQRMKPSREKWIAHQWPLIDLRMTRADCVAWMHRHGYPTPPRSACTFCPFHSDREWAALTADDLADAVVAEREIQAAYLASKRTNGVPYLHRSLQPLGTVVFDPMKNEPSLFGNECEGMCGV